MSYEDIFTLEVHYGGIFRNFPEKLYVQGHVKNLEVDADLIAWFELEELVKLLKYDGGFKLFWREHMKDLEDGLVEVKDDKSVLHMFNSMRGKSKRIPIYVEHLDATPFHDSCNHPKPPQSVARGQLSKALQQPHQEDPQQVNLEEDNIDYDGESVDLSAASNEEYGLTDADSEDLSSFEVPHDDAPNLTQDEALQDVSPEVNRKEPTQGEQLLEKCVPTDNKKKRKQVCSRVENFIQDDGSSSSEDCGTNIINEVHVEDVDSEYEPSLDLRSLHSSSGEEGELGYSEYNADVDQSNPVLTVGLVFANAREFRSALKAHSMKNGYSYIFKRNESNRVRVVCSDPDCKWLIFASSGRGQSLFAIKTYNHIHTCTRAYRNPHIDSTWLGKWYIESFRDDPDIKLEAFISKVKRNYGFDISKTQAYRAKRAALKVIQGSHKEQYWRLRDYCKMVLETNPGSRVVLATDSIENLPHPRFQRIFVAFDAVVRGFKTGCRPIIGLDGCHLKSYFAGILLSAVSVDGNNMMYPIAWAIVEVECKDSWSWFMQLLLETIGHVEDNHWTFISDRQKVRFTIYCIKRVVEGSDDVGINWNVLDKQNSQFFYKRFQRRAFRVDTRQTSNTFRFCFLSVRDPKTQSRFQIGSINLYAKTSYAKTS